MSAEQGETDEEYWERMTRLSPYDKVEMLRDQIDHPNWRQIEAKRKQAERTRGLPAREVREDLGTISRRPSRQVNVKLVTGDFDGLVALAVEHDLPPSSMARLLLRRAILKALNGD